MVDNTLLKEVLKAVNTINVTAKIGLNSLRTNDISLRLHGGSYPNRETEIFYH